MTRVEVNDPPGAPPAAHSYVSGYEAPPLKLNELMADNQTDARGS